MNIQKLLAYTLKAVLSPFFFLPKSWQPIPLCGWYGRLGINVPPLVGHVTAPSVTTGLSGSITTSSATISSNNITATGGENPSERGIAYSTVNSSPTTADSTSLETGSYSTGSFPINLSGLPAGTLVYFTAYAINSGGTGYGTPDSFTTTAAVPSVTTGTAGSITSSTATISGNDITATGGDSPGERGVAYSTSNSNPTTSDLTSYELGTFSTGTYSSNLSGLPAGTLVYFRAYAINVTGTGYGTASSFTTSSGGGGGGTSPVGYYGS